jgi:hypothetical protein
MAYQIGNFVLDSDKLEPVVRSSVRDYRVGEFHFEPLDGDNLEYISKLIHAAVAYYNALVADGRSAGNE